jgi:predicted pyridoxine 5'-phosphate oxidase superfamily flavin-nucleotide-binding protein
MAFHEGELAVQQRAGVQAEAAPLASMLRPTELRAGFARFLADRTFASICARDLSGRLWVSPLFGPAGFLDPATPTTLTVHTAPPVGDPLHQLPAGQSVGLVVIEFASRRRVRVNGILAAANGDALRIDVEQAYGNCPQYIQSRVLTGTPSPATAALTRRGSQVDSADAALIRRADTFFIGTTHPSRGTDASHRGGPPGFLRVDQEELWWPDYSGNNMFNTLGNLAVDRTAALLVPDFANGAIVQLSGSAVTDWTVAGSPGDDDATGRLVRFTVDAVVAGGSLPVRAGAVVRYDRNPPLTD